MENICWNLQCSYKSFEDFESEVKLRFIPNFSTNDSKMYTFIYLCWKDDSSRASYVSVVNYILSPADVRMVLAQCIETCVLVLYMVGRLRISRWVGWEYEYTLEINLSKRVYRRSRVIRNYLYYSSFQKKMEFFFR